MGWITHPNGGCTDRKTHLETLVFFLSGDFTTAVRMGMKRWEEGCVYAST